ncbi:hypothetical protein PR048_019436 [Dryococelus australis]|uniref:Uncharacterized protein n=1 Tax=Dryococelus australis TaxID=614101 RepID=A0ABQ9H3L5_9NEOP|nr:hypothetical protein PR048_019436 [Dryococelus australis]
MCSRWTHPYSKYLYPSNSINTQTCFLTPSPSDVNMESPSPTYGDAGHRESFPSQRNGPTFIHVECIDEESYVEKISNEENTKRLGGVGFPGQAVQIIATASGDKVVNRKVSDGTDGASAEEPVAKVQIQITKDGIKVISDKETTV